MIVVPSLLPEDVPDTFHTAWPDVDATRATELRLIVQYNTQLPLDLFPQFLAAMVSGDGSIKFSKDDMTAWRSGCVLQCGASLLHARLNHTAHEIRLVARSAVLVDASAVLFKAWETLKVQEDGYPGLQSCVIVKCPFIDKKHNYPACTVTIPAKRTDGKAVLKLNCANGKTVASLAELMTSFGVTVHHVRHELSFTIEALHEQVKDRDEYIARAFQAHSQSTFPTNFILFPSALKLQRSGEVLSFIDRLTGFFTSLRGRVFASALECHGMCEFQVRHATAADGQPAFTTYHHPCGVYCTVSDPHRWVKAMAPALKWGVPLLQLSLLALGAIPGAPSLATDITQAVLNGIRAVDPSQTIGSDWMQSGNAANEARACMQACKEYQPSLQTLLLLQSRFSSIVCRVVHEVWIDCCTEWSNPGRVEIGTPQQVHDPAQRPLWSAVAGAVALRRPQAHDG